MRFAFIIFAFFFALGSLQAQGPFIRSIELEYQKAIFDPARGLAIKANHAWKSTDKGVLQSGLLLSGLSAPGSSPGTSGTVDEFVGSFRLQAHTGYERLIFGSDRLYGIAEAFIGARISIVSGSLDQPSQEFNREFSATTLQWDFGTRLGLSYMISSKVGLQLTLTNSWRQVNNPLGIPPGIFFWGPDVLALVGVGASYRL